MTTAADTCSPHPRTLERAAAAAVCVLLLCALLTGLRRFLDSDEIEHLHRTWLMHQGAIPPLAAWFRHTPLLQWVLVPVLALTGETLRLIPIARVLVFLLSCLSLRLVYLITRDLFGSRLQAWLAVLLLQGSTIWLLKAPEIRPDSLMLPLALLALWLLVRHAQEPRAGALLGAGVAAGAAFCGKQNAAVVFLPVAGIVAADQVFRRRRVSPWILLGTVALAALGTWLTPAGRFLDTAMRDLVPGPSKFWPWHTLWLSVRYNPLLPLLFLGQLFRPLRLRPDVRIFRLHLYGIVAVGLLFLFLMNRPWPQELLATTACASIVASAAFADLLNWLGPRRSAAPLALALLLPLAAGLYLAVARPMTRQLRTARATLALTAPGEPVFDAFGQAIFRPHPLDPHFLLYQPTLFGGLARLQQSPIRVLVKDDLYYPHLPAAVRQWCEAEFVPSGLDPYVFVRRPAADHTRPDTPSGVD